MRFERGTDKKDGNWIYIVCVLDFYKILSDLHLFTFFFFFNGENLRGYVGV